jgi:hypothetical protein
MVPILRFQYIIITVLLLVAALWSAGGRPSTAGGQEPKRYVYKVVDVQPDNATMQTTLNEYGAAGWELIVIGMGDMTVPRLVFKK